MPREAIFEILPIDPALPDDFVALDRDGGVCFYNWVGWGPEKAIKAFFEDENAVDHPIIFVTISPNVVQSYRGRLDEKYFKSAFKAEGFDVSFGNWGKYPWCMAERTSEGKTDRMGYIGMNASDGSMLCLKVFTPSTPEGEAHADELWNAFFKESKLLPEPLYIKAQGQEMHLGYTILNVAGQRVKIIAETRKRDGRSRIACVPENACVQFHCKDAFTTKMGLSWHFGDPIAKVLGIWEVENSYGRNMIEITAGVLVEEVDEFSQISIVKKNNYIKEVSFPVFKYLGIFSRDHL